jgi:hypothetical protein
MDNNTLVQITTKYYENYNDSGEGEPHWKPKGFQLFQMRADSDCFMYAEPIAVAAIKSLLKEYTNTHNKFEYISHKLIFSEPIELKNFYDRFNTFAVLAKASELANPVSNSE